MDPNRVQAVIFDLSGTLIDFGSRGPVVAFVELFRRQGIEVSEAEARQPMGSHKWDHIWAVLQQPAVAARWIARHRRPPEKSDVDAMYPAFTALQLEVLARHVDVLPGVPELVRELTARNISYSTTTGFDSGMMPPVWEALKAAGIEPVATLTPDVVGAGRPAPWMIFEAARRMARYPLSQFVKVGDTPVDIAEARNAGCWAVAVVDTGNELGFSQQQLTALPQSEHERLAVAAREKFLGLGAHFVISRTADLLPVIAEIEVRLARGERP
jgi:phosphonoacetaldehyde hydrolase